MPEITKIQVNKNDPSWGIPHLSRVFVSYLKTEFISGKLINSTNGDFHIETIDLKTNVVHINRITKQQCLDYNLSEGMIHIVYKKYATLSGELFKETKDHINFRIKNMQNNKFYFKVLAKSEIKGLKIYYDDPFED
jgi:hypothetical protein